MGKKACDDHEDVWREENQSAALADAQTLRAIVGGYYELREKLGLQGYDPRPGDVVRLRYRSRVSLSDLVKSSGSRSNRRARFYRTAGRLESMLVDLSEVDRFVSLLTDHERRVLYLETCYPELPVKAGKRCYYRPEPTAKRRGRKKKKAPPRVAPFDKCEVLAKYTGQEWSRRRYYAVLEAATRGLMWMMESMDFPPGYEWKSLRLWGWCRRVI